MLRRGRRSTNGRGKHPRPEEPRREHLPRALWRTDARQRSLTLENLPAAEHFKTLLDDHGPDEALRVIEFDEIGRHVPTVTEWLHTHTSARTGSTALCHFNPAAVPARIL